MQKSNDDKKFQDLEKDLQGFDEGKLNLTGGDKQQDVFDPEIEKQYEKFMKEMNLQGQEHENMDNFSNLMSNLLSNISKNMGDDDNQEEGKEDEELKKKMEDMFKDLDGGNFQDIANKLLHKFMDKDMLKEPMEETKLAYEATFKNPDIQPADMERYQRQYQIVLQILDQLQKDPNNKQGLIEKFERMQEYGNPPQGIETGFGLK